MENNESKNYIQLGVTVPQTCINVNELTAHYNNPLLDMVENSPIELVEYRKKWQDILHNDLGYRLDFATKVANLISRNVTSEKDLLSQPDLAVKKWRQCGNDSADAITKLKTYLRRLSDTNE